MNLSLLRGSPFVLLSIPCALSALAWPFTDPGDTSAPEPPECAGPAAASQDAGSFVPRFVVADYAPGTDPAYVRELEQRLNGLRQPGAAGTTERFVAASRWPGNVGDPITLTWSFVPDGTPGSASTLFATLDLQFAGAGGRAVWVQRFVDCFARWDELTGITFQRIVVASDADDGAPWGADGAPGLRGDIRIAMAPIDGPFGMLAFGQFPNSPVNKGDIGMDSAENWLTTPWLNIPGWGFQRTVNHEIGHAIGLDHVCPVDTSKLMEAFSVATISYWGPQHDDLRGGQLLYGDPFEPNDSLAAPWYLGIPLQVNNLNIGDITEPLGPFGPAPLSSGKLSIDAPGDVDVFAIGFENPTHVQIILRPQGLIYPNVPMNCGSTFSDCCTNQWTFSHTIANLRLELLDRTGQLITSGTTSGGNLTIVYQVLPFVNVPYFVRVSAITPFFTSPQTYDLDFTTHPGVGCPTLTCDDGNPVNGVEYCLANECYVGYPGGDCNANYIDDFYDIQLGNSIDCNGDLVPDECQTDCNQNGQLDSCDIAQGVSTDCDSNGVPDECETDCNGNGISDPCDIASGSSADANLNGVPDECESTLRVPSQFPTLRAALDAAQHGDTVLVAPGTYTGPDNRNLEIFDKTVQLVSENGPYQTTLDLQSLGNLVAIGRNPYTANRSRVQGFTIQNGNDSVASWPHGGAIYVIDADATIERCIFRYNTASGEGGGIYFQQYLSTSSPEVISCIFHDNTSFRGGAVFLTAAYVANGMVPRLLNCTFSENSASYAGGAISTELRGERFEIINGIVWRNAPSTNQIEDPSLAFTVESTDLPPAHIGQYGGPGNVSIEPRFIAPSSDDFRIRRLSPCRNAGSLTYQPLPGARDIEGQKRVMENRTDMGADEVFVRQPIGPVIHP